MSQTTRYHPTATMDIDADNNTSAPGQRYESLRGSDGSDDNISQKHGHSTKSPWTNITRHVDSLRPSHHKGEWRPKALSYTYFFFTLSFVALIWIAAELVLHRSQRLGYIFFPRDGDVDNLPASQNFAYQYLPTLVGVLYGTVWTLVWHEVLRLEPWYQLSSDKGASLEDSLGMNYKENLPFLIPFVAFRKRHWAIFCGSLTSMFSSFGLTPLLGAGFAVKTITVSRPDTFIVNPSLIQPNLQRKLTAEFMYDAYDTAWLNASLPAYTTNEYGIAPFELAGGYKAQIGEIPVFKARTTIYTSDVTCQTAKVIPKKNASDPFEKFTFIHPTKNCSAGSGITSHFGYFRCSWCKETNVFAGNWSYEDVGNQAIVFCDVGYSKADATVYYAPSNSTVVKIEDIGSFSKLRENEFNSTSFNRNIGGLIQSSSDEFPISWFPPGQDQVAQYYTPRLYFTPWVTPVISQGIGLKKIRLEKMTRKTFIETVTLGHKSLLAHAMPYLLDKSPAASTTVKGTQSQTGEAVVAVTAIIIIVEVICGLVLIMMLALMVSVKRRRNNLQQEPASLGALMSLVAGSRALREHFTGLDEADNTELKKMLPTGKYKLQVWRDSKNAADGVYKLDIDSSEGTHYADTHAGGRHEEKSKPNDLPFILRPIAGLLALAFFLAMIGLVAGFYAKSKKENGLPLISKTLFWEQLVYSYIPIGLAQLFEMLWTEILGTLAVLQPWITMSQGPTPSISSLSVKYTAVPPALLLPRSLKGGHLFLALGSLMPWCSYVIPVAAGALFNRKFTTVERRVPLARVVQPVFEPAYRDDFAGFSLNTAMGRPPANSEDGTSEFQIGPRVYDNRIKDMYAGSLFDQYEGLRVNFTRGVVPAWTSVGVYFVPFSFVGGNITTGNTVRGRTTGFTGGLECTELTKNNKYEPVLNTTFIGPHEGFTGGSIYNYALNLTADIPDFTKPYSKDRPTKKQKVIMGHSLRWGGSGGGLPYEFVFGINGKSALELEPLMIADLEWPKNVNSADGPALNDSDFRQVMQWSQALLVAGWIRLEPDDGLKYDSKWIACEQVLSAATYDVTVDPTARILGYKQVSGKTDVRTEPDKYFDTEAELYRFLSSTSNLFQNATQTKSRNSSFPNSWKTIITGDVANELGIEGYLDPTAPLKNTSDLVKVYSESYRRLFPIIVAQNSQGLLKKRSGSSSAVLKQVVGVSRGDGVPDGSAHIISSAERVFASTSMAILLIALVAVNCVVAAAVYVGGVGIAGFGDRYKGMKMRAPLTMQMLIARIYDSDALDDVRGTERMDTKEREDVLVAKGGMYSYGASGGRGGLGGAWDEGRDEVRRRVQVERHVVRRM